MKKAAAVFLDRDGTINEEVGYLDSLEKLRMIPEAFEAVRLINQAGMKAVVISNQSGVARGFFDEAFLKTVHDRIQALLHERGIRIDRFYYCPHHPAEGTGPYRTACPCRKPEAGMFLRAAQEMGIDLARSYMVGDMSKDIEAAHKAGVKGILVQTGHGASQCGPMIGGSPLRPEKPSARKRGHGEVMNDEKPSAPSPEASDRPPAEPFSSAPPDYIAGDVLDAVKWIMRDRSL